ncbi:hypothetical protein [Natronobacterium texcoconense]|uniref:Phospholipase_D-nuclease N-terminal n=1 Tax=Natronobacterium texcoconense TaxID=1095778 RepID=A0A1H1G9N5_NATTX|nr:hypothetical protein [Natronobacterium texcoconense]SDR09795.1 hypothetical protein SAMN04489842_2325 [Natronobacterium texcoconense]
MDAIIVLALTVIFVSIHGLLSILVLRDAEKRGIENSVTWAGIVAIFPAVGLAVYLIRRTMPEDEAEAPEDVPEDAEFPLPGTERSNGPAPTNDE